MLFWHYIHNICQLYHKHRCIFLQLRINRESKKTYLRICVIVSFLLLPWNGNAPVNISNCKGTTQSLFTKCLPWHKFIVKRLTISNVRSSKLYETLNSFKISNAYHKGQTFLWTVVVGKRSLTASKQNFHGHVPIRSLFFIHVNLSQWLQLLVRKNA